MRAIPTQDEAYQDGSSDCKGIDIGGVIGQSRSPDRYPGRQGKANFAQNATVEAPREHRTALLGHRNHERL